MSEKLNGTTHIVSIVCIFTMQFTGKGFNHDDPTGIATNILFAHKVASGPEPAKRSVDDSTALSFKMSVRVRALSTNREARALEIVFPTS